MKLLPQTNDVQRQTFIRNVFFFHDRPSAARHIVMIICGNGNVPALGAFHFVFVGFDLGRFSAVSLAG